MRQREARLRNLHDAIVARLQSSRLKNRFSVGFNQETLRWILDFERLSDNELDAIYNLSFHVCSDRNYSSAAVAHSDAEHRAVHTTGLTSTEVRDLARAVATQFPAQ
jgi:hypothetical protein